MTRDALRSDAAPSVDAPPLLQVVGVDVAPAAEISPVLRNISFAVHRGECVALVGPSGAGKTTLLRTLALQLPLRSGSLILEGLDLTRLTAARLRSVRTRIALIAQKQDLVDALRVDKNVMAGALGRWSAWRALRFLVWPQVEELNEANRALAAVGLDDKLRRPTAALSGGEQQRVAIARALVQAPALLLADEPVSSLDPRTAHDVLALLTQLARRSGMGLICSLHQPQLAERFCDRVLEVQHGTLSEHISSPRAALATLA